MAFLSVISLTINSSLMSKILPCATLTVPTVHLPVLLLLLLPLCVGARSTFFSLLIYSEIHDLFGLLQCAYGTHHVWNHSISATRQSVFRWNSWETLEIFITPFSISLSSLGCYRSFSPSQSLSCSLICTNRTLLLHSSVHIRFCSCAWVFAPWMSELGNSSILNLVALCFLFTHCLCTIRFCVCVCVCDSSIVGGVCLCTAFFALDSCTSSNMTRLLIAYIHYLYEYVISIENEWERCKKSDLDPVSTRHTQERKGNTHAHTTSCWVGKWPIGKWLCIHTHTHSNLSIKK